MCVCIRCCLAIMVAAAVLVVPQLHATPIDPPPQSTSTSVQPSSLETPQADKTATEASDPNPETGNHESNQHHKPDGDDKSKVRRISAAVHTSGSGTDTADGEGPITAPAPATAAATSAHTRSLDEVERPIAEVTKIQPAARVPANTGTAREALPTSGKLEPHISESVAELIRPVAEAPTREAASTQPAASTKPDNKMVEGGTTSSVVDESHTQQPPAQGDSVPSADKDVGDGQANGVEPLGADTRHPSGSGGASGAESKPNDHTMTPTEFEQATLEAHSPINEEGASTKPASAIDDKTNHRGNDEPVDNIPAKASEPTKNSDSNANESELHPGKDNLKDRQETAVNEQLQPVLQDTSKDDKSDETPRLTENFDQLSVSSFVSRIKNDLDGYSTSFDNEWKPKEKVKKIKDAFDMANNVEKGLDTLSYSKKCTSTDREKYDTAKSKLEEISTSCETRKRWKEFQENKNKKEHEIDEIVNKAEIDNSEIRHDDEDALKLTFERRKKEELKNKYQSIKNEFIKLKEDGLKEDMKDYEECIKGKDTEINEQLELLTLSYNHLYIICRSLID